MSGGVMENKEPTLQAELENWLEDYVPAGLLKRCGEALQSIIKREVEAERQRILNLPEMQQETGLKSGHHQDTRRLRARNDFRLELKKLIKNPQKEVQK